MPTNYGTDYIGYKAAVNVLHGVRFAMARGTPINALVTISFDALGLDDDAAGGTFASLKERIARWWAYQAECGRNFGAFCSVHSHANPNGKRHVHWMLHIPAGATLPEIHEVIGKRLKKLTGAEQLGDALHSKEVYAPGGAAKYILKGISPAYADQLYIQPAHEGRILCPRTGVSRALSKAARIRAGWARKRRFRRR